MAKKIRGNDIIEDGHLKDAITQAKELLTVYKELDRVILKTAADSKKTAQGADTGSAEGIKRLNTELQRSNEIKKAKIQIDQQIVKSEAKLTALETKQAQQLAKTKLEIQRKNKALKEEAILTSKTSTEYEKQSVRLNQLRRRLKDLTLTEGEGSKATRKLRAQVQALDSRLKRADASAGQFQRSVGNYGKALGRVGGMLRGFGATLLATFSIRAIGSFFKNSIEGFRTQEKAVKKVEQAINSTGGAAGRTSGELQELAKALQENSLFGDEEILNNVSAQLLTFTNIAGDQFNRTQQVALDLATVLDGDLKSASIQLGKALNDPKANLSALSRSGIQFSKEQKELINSLVDTNRLADAQNVILGELERQYGGQAKAAAEADGGIQQLKNTFGDLQEIIGGELLKVIGPIAKDFKKFIQELDPEDVKAFARAIGSVIQAFANWGKELFGVIASLGKATDSVGNFADAWQKLLRFANPFGPMMQALDNYVMKLLDAEEATEELTDAQKEQRAEQKRLNKITEQAVIIGKDILKQNQDELEDIPGLIDLIGSETATREEKNAAIAKLKEDYPDIIKGIDLETASTEQLIQVKKNLITSLLKEQIERRKTAELARITGRVAEIKALEALGLATAKDIQDLKNLEFQLGLVDEITAKTTEGAEDFAENYAKGSSALVGIDDKIADLRVQIEAVNKEIDKTGDPSGTLNERLLQLQTELNGLLGDRTNLINDFFDADQKATKETITSGKKALTEEEKNINRIDELKKQQARDLIKLENDLLKRGFERADVDRLLNEKREAQFGDLLAFIQKVGLKNTEIFEKAENDYLKFLENLNKATEKIGDIASDKVEQQQKKTSTAVLNTTKDLTDEIGGIEDALNGAFEETTKEAIKEQDELIKGWEKFRDESLKIFKEITDGRLKELDRQIDARKENVKESQDEIKRLQKIADSGQGQAATDAAKAIKAEQARIAKEKLEVEKLEKKKRNLLIITTGLEKAAQNINFGDPNPFKNAVSGVKNFLSDLPQLSGGTVGTVADALGRTGITDGHIVRVDDNEHILSIKDSEKLHRAGLRTNEQIVNSALSGNNNIVVNKSMRGQASPDSKIIERLNAVEQAIKNQKPVKVVQQHIDISTGKETIIDGDNKTNVYHKPKPIVI